jgi:hypothetical protein
MRPRPPWGQGWRKGDSCQSEKFGDKLILYPFILYVADEKRRALISGERSSASSDEILHLWFLQDLPQRLLNLFFPLLLPHLCLPIAPADSS